VSDAPLSPVEVEKAISAISNRIAKSVQVCSDRYRDFLHADHQYDLAYARAYLDAPGSIQAKKYEAELMTEHERAARDVADVAYKHADRLAKALDAELRAMQSIGASIRNMYATAGRGEG
jgi:hypothetical protein